VRGAKDARVLVLSGEPILEPVVSYGPFVMNTREQIIEAVRDYESGKMGHLR
jgi:redox-sensitive bicupin YhaK (pirin superfamily)